MLKNMLSVSNFIAGWAISVRANLYVECEAHAIWQTPDNEIIDITPNDEEYSQTLFSPQLNMIVKQKPSIFIPLTQSALVEEYIAIRNQLEELRCSSQEKQFKIPPELTYRMFALDDVFSIKVGRNDKCPCESGLKYKKCCGR